MSSPPSGRDASALEGVSLERLRGFLSVVDAGGFTRAADGDPTRQSQLSRQVKELEAALGCVLLQRSRTGAAPTEAGQRLATLARELLQGLGALKKQRARWSFGAGDSVLRWLVIPALGTLASDPVRGLFSLQALEVARVVEGLREGRIDFGIVRDRAPTGLASASLGKLEYALFVPAALVRAHRVERAEDVLERVPLALQRSERELTDPLLERNGGRVELACETFPQACTAVQCGRYAALLPTIAGVELPERSVRRFSVPQLPSRALLLAWDRRRIDARPGGPALRARLQRALEPGD